MTRLRRTGFRLARRVVRGLPPAVRDVALSLASRAVLGPAVLPGPPPGPVLVVAAHPDDETIGAGGVLARHASVGDRVSVLVATSGEATTGGRGDVATTRERECGAACRELGLGPPRFLRLTDGGLADEVDRLAAAVAEASRNVATVYIPSLLDPHGDHRAVNTAVAAVDLQADIYGYEIWAAAPVDVIVAIDDVWERKARALRCYATALETVDYVRAVNGLAAYRSIAGGLAGAGLAEGFLRLSAAEHRALVHSLPD